MGVFLDALLATLLQRAALANIVGPFTCESEYCVKCSDRGYVRPVIEYDCNEEPNVDVVGEKFHAEWLQARPESQPSSLWASWPGTCLGSSFFTLAVNSNLPELVLSIPHHFWLCTLPLAGLAN